MSKILVFQMGLASRKLCSDCVNPVRSYCKGILCKNKYTCKVVIVGGGTGGCSIVWRLSHKLKRNDIILLEPSKLHYYQPLFSMIAAGENNINQSSKPVKTLLPSTVCWMEDRAEDFDPRNNIVYTASGNKILYDYMIIAVGLKNDYNLITGLKQALDDGNSPVATIYSPVYCKKCWTCISQFQGGHALFTFPKQAGKCAGAAQKIMYLADDYWRQRKVRDNTNITYLTAGKTLFGVPKYVEALSKVAAVRNITTNFGVDLVEVTKKGAMFVDAGGKCIELPYNLLHVTPPMSPPNCITKCKELVSTGSYLDVDKYTLQHIRYPNVFGLGDCTNTPNSKTAAAIGPQSRVVAQNLLSIISGKKPIAKYDGYGACPLLTSYKKGILAEFLYGKKVWETFPFDQSKEHRLLSYINRNIFPYIYWNKLIKGKWNGPSTLRKIVNPFGK